MIEIIFAGQTDKLHLLHESYRLRKRVFRDRMGWDVAVTDDGLEIDDFDLPQAIYLLALNHEGHVVGNWRLLPTTGAYMIRDVWPEFRKTLPIEEHTQVWEASRFSVDSPATSDDGLAQIHLATQEMFCGLTEFCIAAGIREICTLYDMRIARLLRRLDCAPRAVSHRMNISGTVCEAGIFTTDHAMLQRLRAATGITQPLIDGSRFSTRLEHLIHQHAPAPRDYEVAHVA